MSKLNAVDLGYKIRWVYLAFWLMLVVYGLSWMSEMMFEGEFYDKPWMPSLEIRYAIEDVTGLGRQSPNLHGFDGVLGMQFDYNNGGVSWGRVGVACITAFTVLFCMIMFVPLLARANQLPARRKLTWRAMAACLIMGSFLLTACVMIIVTQSADFFSFIYYGQWEELPALSLRGGKGGFNVPSVRSITWEYAAPTPACTATILVSMIILVPAFIVLQRRADRYWILEKVSRWYAAIACIVAIVAIGLGELDATQVLGRREGYLSAQVLCTIVLTWALGCRVWLLFLLQKYRRGTTGNECFACGYDLRGTIAADRKECPECGTTVPDTLMVKFQDEERNGSDPPAKTAGR